MKLIIELEEDVYRRVKNNPQIFKNACEVAIQNGTPIEAEGRERYESNNNR